MFPCGPFCKTLMSQQKDIFEYHCRFLSKLGATLSTHLFSYEMRIILFVGYNSRSLQGWIHLQVKNGRKVNINGRVKSASSKAVSISFWFLISSQLELEILRLVDLYIYSSHNDTNRYKHNYALSFNTKPVKWRNCCWFFIKLNNLMKYISFSPIKNT